MGILDRFQVKAGGWQASAGQPWELDLDAAAVAGVALRDPATLLWKLGPAEDPHASAQGRYCYFTRGVEAEAARQRVQQWRIYWQDAAGRFLPFTGPCRFHGAEISLRGGLGEAEIEALFGPPLWRDEAAEGARWFYARHAVDWELRLSRAQGLEELCLSAQPLFARDTGTAPPSQVT
jgi:hypothetical protein